MKAETWLGGKGGMAEAPSGAALVVRLLRRWTAARAAEKPALPSLVSLAAELDVPAQAALALASVFQLTESCLDRPLQAECCCSPLLSADERALLLLLESAPLPAAPAGSASVPHGLPAALVWAVRSAKRLLEMNETPEPADLRGCPFGPTAAAGPVALAALIR